jgi:phosphoglycerate dehydrogenase-like enzyme
MSQPTLTFTARAVPQTASRPAAPEARPVAIPRFVSRDTAFVVTTALACVVAMQPAYAQPAPALPATAPASAAATAPMESIDALIQRLGLVESPAPVRERAGWTAPKVVLMRAMPPQVFASLQKSAPGVTMLQASSEQEAVKLAERADAVIGFCSDAVLAAGKRIRWVQALSAGVEECVQTPALAERDILLTNMQRVAGPVMAEHVLAMMLASARGLDFFIPERMARRWTDTPAATSRMISIEGKNLLVVGLGGIGTEVARRASALGMNVSAIRASGREGPPFVRYVGLPGELHTLAANADFIVNTTPLTPETRGLFDAKFFAAAKRGAYFVNVGRGQSVVQRDLVDALRSGQLAGAGLDVTDPEPLPSDDPLWSFGNVIITPHVSTASDLGQAARIAIAAENLRRYSAGERMLSVVDVKKGY